MTGIMYYPDYQKLRMMSMDTFGRLGLPTTYALGSYNGFDFSDIFAKANALGLNGTNATLGQSTYNYVMLYLVFMPYFISRTITCFSGWLKWKYGTGMKRLTLPPQTYLYLLLGL
jgi:hypothetical protein